MTMSTVPAWASHMGHISTEISKVKHNSKTIQVRDTDIHVVLYFGMFRDVSEVVQAHPEWKDVGDGCVSRQFEYDPTQTIQHPSILMEDVILWFTEAEKRREAGHVLSSRDVEDLFLLGFQDETTGEWLTVSVYDSFRRFHKAGSRKEDLLQKQMEVFCTPALRTKYFQEPSFFAKRMVGV